MKRFNNVLRASVPDNLLFVIGYHNLETGVACATPAR